MDPRYLSFGDLLFKPIADTSVQALPVVQAMPLDSATGHHVPFAGFESIMAGDATLGQALRPTPQYTQEGSNSQNRRFYEGTGKSNYYALQVKLEKRFSKDLSFVVAYTWSKTLTDAESQFSEFSGFTQDPYNRKGEKSYSLNDYPQNLVVNYLYELPFGPGQQFAKGRRSGRQDRGRMENRRDSTVSERCSQYCQRRVTTPYGRLRALTLSSPVPI